MYHVYVIGTGTDRQKIGYTSDLKARLSMLQTGNPEQLKVHHAIEVPDEERARKVERKIHQELSYKRLKGEWFKMTVNEAIDFLTYAEIRWIDDPLI